MSEQTRALVPIWVHVVAWANFALALAAVLKFIPLVVSLSDGVTLTPEQLADGAGEARLWALDLISDTPLILLVWFVVGMLLRKYTGRHRFMPWADRFEQAVTNDQSI